MKVAAEQAQIKLQSKETVKIPTLPQKHGVAVQHALSLTQPPPVKTVQSHGVLPRKTAVIPEKLSPHSVESKLDHESDGLPPLPEQYKIVEQTGRGSSHKIVFKLKDSTHVLLSTFPDKYFMLESEIDAYHRLQAHHIRCPDVTEIYRFEADDGVRIGYVATRMTGQEYKFMQLGLAKKQVFGAWREQRDYKDRLRRLKEDIENIEESKLFFEDFQCFINDDGRLWVIDPTGIGLGQATPDYGELDLLRERIVAELGPSAEKSS